MKWETAAKFIESIREARGKYPSEFCTHYRDDPPDRPLVEFVEPLPLSIQQIYFSLGPEAPVRSPKTVKVRLGVCGGTPVNAGLYLMEGDATLWSWWLREGAVIVEVPREALRAGKSL